MKFAKFIMWYPYSEEPRDDLIAVRPDEVVLVTEIEGWEALDKGSGVMAGATLILRDGSKINVLGSVVTVLAELENPCPADEWAERCVREKLGAMPCDETGTPNWLKERT